MNDLVTIFGFPITAALSIVILIIAVAVVDFPEWMEMVFIFQAGMWLEIGLAYRAGWRKHQ